LKWEKEGRSGSGIEEGKSDSGRKEFGIEEMGGEWKIGLRKEIGIWLEFSLESKLYSKESLRYVALVALRIRSNVVQIAEIPIMILELATKM
jgi:hypothetical protein